MISFHSKIRLLNPESEFLDYLGMKFKYESAIGLNGRVWIKAASLQVTLLIANYFNKLEHIDEEELKQELQF